MGLSVEHLRPILVADDQADDLFFIRRLFRNAGIENPLVAVDDGEQAIHYLEGCIQTGRLPCMAFIDIRMPRCGGFDVLEWAQREHAVAELPFIVMSSSSLPTDRERAIALGARDYVEKFPVVEKLVPIVDRYGAQRVHTTLRAS